MQVQNNITKLYETLIKFEDRVDSDDRIVQLLEEYLDRCIVAGANINQMLDGIQGDTLLHKAVREGKIHVVQALIHKGAKTEVVNLCEQTPRQLAEKKSLLMFFPPLQKKETPPVFEFTGLTISHESYFKAVRSGKKNLVEHLLNVGSKNLLISRDNDLRNALHIAASEGHVALVEILIKNGLDVEAKDKNGQSPLFLASQAGHLQIATLLLKEGCGRNTCDKYNQTPLHVAAAAGQLDVVTMLASSTNNEHISECVYMKDSGGRRPIDVATPKTKVYEYLLFVEELDKKTKCKTLP